MLSDINNAATYLVLYILIVHFRHSTN